MSRWKTLYDKLGVDEIVLSAKRNYQDFEDHNIVQILKKKPSMQENTRKKIIAQHGTLKQI